MPKISDLAAATALAAGHVLPVVQGSGTRKATMTQVAEFMAANGYPTTGAMARTAVEHAFRRRFMGPDGTEQVRIEGTPLAVEFWRMGGAIAGAGPFLMAWSETQADVPAVIGGKGKGSVFLANGAGPMLEAMEGGANKQVDAPLQVRGGATDWTTQPGIYAPASRKLWMGVAGKRVMEVRADSAGAGDTVALGFAVDATLAKIVAEGSNTNVALYMQTKGTGNLTVGNGATGNIAFFQPATGGAAVAVLQFQSGPSGQPADITVNADAGPLRLGVTGRVNIAGGVALGGKVVRNAASGYANLALTATTGHVFIDGASTIAAAAFTMPASAALMDGQRISFTASQTVTALTLTANTAQTMVGAPTTMDVTTPFTLVFDSTTGKWTRA
ncbi:MAG: hypothetical protein K2X46_15035 [Roseomonas sp.]|nr:hypothetical protein [Roseomonas sp.]